MKEAQGALAGLTLVFACQLAGEAAARLLDLPVPGPVLGMIVLLIGLVLGGVPRGVRRVARGLLTYLPLFFVPAGVGLVTHGARLRADWLALAAGIVGSTLLTMLIVGWLVQRLAVNADGDD